MTEIAEREALPGVARPLGASVTRAGVNFAVHAQHAERMFVCIYDATGTRETVRYALTGRTGNIWHGVIPAADATAGMLYGLRASGPYQPELGHRYNANKLLLDPAALQIDGRVVWQPAVLDTGPGTQDGAHELDSAPFVPRCRVVESSYDWQGDRPPATPWRDTFIYELHVKGFTQLHPDVPPEWRGKYLGLTVPAVLEYLQRLGVTTVELLPVQAFASEQFLLERGLTNYWGYNPLGWSAPDQRYAVADPVREFRDMVRALHRAGIEVILDVVYNHTAEGGDNGATLSWRGLDNRSYYRLLHTDRRHFENVTGTGNTVAIDQPAALDLVLTSLRYWAEEMHVDGFRFDLAPVLARDSGGFNPNAPFFAALRADPVLAYVKLIAEPWDIGFGGYQLGNFPSGWSEWNDRYRDTVRAYWRGDGRLLGSLAERFSGSSDLFRQAGRKPTASINYLAAHDGFTLRDVVSYDHKHNEANLEDNHDGHMDNLSWNCGVEGATDDVAVLGLRDRQVRNMLATLFFSQGVPMLLAGDEFGRTQRGNNNAYCQDNEISWVDWTLARDNAAMVEFVAELARLRRERGELRRDTFLKGSVLASHSRDVLWWHPRGQELTGSDWHDPYLRTLAIGIGSNGSNHDLLLLLNPTGDSCEFQLPMPVGDLRWRQLLDSSLARPFASQLVAERSYVVPSRCVVAFEQVVV
ncbi:MAG TPA: glycogen debranching protein GlgX [Steroidobacteraceae bacterium]|nr:glycogen debranching protein GlgX [Steroidobacteraceae bacterium]HRX89406.1 glycogen debranching protein GlgX [Steroidobacteraceae bacterium]